MSAAPRLTFDLPGDWTSARLLLRLLAAIDSPWDARMSGFTHRDTGECADLSMSPPRPELADLFAAGVDPIDPTIDDALLEAIHHHRSVVTVTAQDAPPDARADAIADALAVVRATAAIVTGGALAARCRSSGVAHGADAFHALVQVIDAVDADGGDVLPHLVRLVVRFDLLAEPPRTVGMGAFGVDEVTLPAAEQPGPAPDPSLAHARLVAAALAALRTPEDPSPGAVA